jgi:hypothetical protein
MLTRIIATMERRKVAFLLLRCRCKIPFEAWRLLVGQLHGMRLMAGPLK